MFGLFELFCEFIFRTWLALLPSHRQTSRETLNLKSANHESNFVCVESENVGQTHCTPQKVRQHLAVSFVQLISVIEDASADFSCRTFGSQLLIAGSLGADIFLRNFCNIITSTIPQQIKINFYCLSFQALDVIRILKEKEAIKIERAQMRLKVSIPGQFSVSLLDG